MPGEHHEYISTSVGVDTSRYYGVRLALPIIEQRMASALRVRRR
jgi:hypothetical protein